MRRRVLSGVVRMVVVGCICALLSMMPSQHIHADIRFNKHSAFTLMNENSSIELPNLSIFSGRNENIAHWSKKAFKSYESGDDYSLWSLFAEDGDVIAIPQSSSQSGSNGNVIDPSRFYIPENRQVYVTQDTLIDGDGHTLELKADARIVVDHGVTLTLRNMRIKSTRNDLANPIVRPMGHGACVALQDVELSLADDFIFRDGKLFIHGDVVISGTHTFSYRSTQKSYICDGATLGFDHGATFFYYPSSRDNHLIQMVSDVSGGGSSEVSDASMYLDSATLQTTHTGIRLSNGVLCLDNSVTLSSAAQTRMDTLSGKTSVDATTVITVDWSPDGKYLAIGTNGGNLEIYQFDSIGSPILVNVASKTEGVTIQSVTWRPDGRYLAVGTNANPTPSEPGNRIGNNHELQIYRFDTISTVTLIGITSKDQGNDATISVDWSPDGKYLAIGTGADPESGPDEGIEYQHEARVYSFDGNTLTGIDSKNQDVTVQSVSWSPDGKYLAVGTNANPPTSEPNIGGGSELRIYRFDGTILTGIVGIDSPANKHLFCIDWSPDGRYIASGSDGYASGTPLKVHHFDTSQTTSLQEVGSYTHAWRTGGDVKWSPDGSYIACGFGGGAWPTYGYLRVFKFTENNLVSAFYKEQGRYTFGVSWRPDGSHIAIGTNLNPTTSEPGITVNHELRVYEAGYNFDTRAQTINTGIIFGDSSQAGGLGNLDVQVLGGATVEIAGLVVDDSA